MTDDEERIINALELVRKFELGDYEVLKPSFHYRFKLTAGVIERISSVEILNQKEMLQKKGLYVKAQTAKIYKFSEYKQRVK